MRLSTKLSGSQRLRLLCEVRSPLLVQNRGNLLLSGYFYRLGCVVTEPLQSSDELLQQLQRLCPVKATTRKTPPSSDFETNVPESPVRLARYRQNHKRRELGDAN